MTSPGTGNLAGYASVIASVLLWGWGFATWAHLTQWDPGFASFCILGIFSFILPILAGWKASKLWFLMLLSPAIGYIVILAHTCG